MYMVWHFDKYKITFKLVINWTNEIFWHIVVSSGLSRPGIIDARAQYRAAARRLINTMLNNQADFQFSSGWRNIWNTSFVSTMTENLFKEIRKT